MIDEPTFAAQTNTPWVFSPRPNSQARLRLFCFPYAGGGANLFRSWPDNLPADVEVKAIRLPGRETRLRERPFTHLTPLVEELVEVLRPYLHSPFAFFGHSMGGLISFELARQLRRQGLPQPVHLFVSSHRAPHLPLPHPQVHQAPEAQFIARLRGLNGTPEIFLQDDGLRELLLPLLRADFAIWETYRFSSDEPFAFPISAFIGEQDQEVSVQEMGGWGAHTEAGFRLRVFAGDHFYWQNDTMPLLRILSDELRRH